LQYNKNIMKRKHESTRSQQSELHLSSVTSSQTLQNRLKQLNAASDSTNQTPAANARGQHRQNKRRQEAQAFEEPQDDDEDDDDEIFNDANDANSGQLDASDDEAADKAQNDSDDSDAGDLTADLTRNRKERAHRSAAALPLATDDSTALNDAETIAAAASARHARTVDAAEQRQADRLRQQSGLDSESMHQPESLHFNSHNKSIDEQQRLDQLAKRSIIMQRDEAEHQRKMHALFDKRKGDVYDDFSEIEKHSGAGASVLDGGHAAIDEAN
jgi:hypothetical protein